MTNFEGCPQLKPGCRLSSDGDVLLIPEGVLRLHGPARHIVEACDGKHTVQQIVAQLLTKFVNSDAVKVAVETETFLGKLVDKGVIEFV